MKFFLFLSLFVQLPEEKILDVLHLLNCICQTCKDHKQGGVEITADPIQANIWRMWNNSRSRSSYQLNISKIINIWPILLLHCSLKTRLQIRRLWWNNQLRSKLMLGLDQSVEEGGEAAIGVDWTSSRRWKLPSLSNILQVFCHCPGVFIFANIKGRKRAK